MHRTNLLIVTALGEAGTGLLLLISPSILQALLLKTTDASPEATLLARIAGAALLAIGVACWLGRSGPPGSAQFGLIAGVLIYDAAAAGLLASFGLYSSHAGIALWPAVALHAVLAAWCVACLWKYKYS